MIESTPSVELVVVLVTAPDGDTAARLGRTVVEERLAACVNIVPGLRSIYEFEGKTCDDPEVLCLFKTRRELYPALRRSEEHTSELQSLAYLVCRLLLEKK